MTGAADSGFQLGKVTSGADADKKKKKHGDHAE
jgi:Importin beta binding domain